MWRSAITPPGPFDQAHVASLAKRRMTCGARSGLLKTTCGEPHRTSLSHAHACARNISPGVAFGRGPRALKLTDIKSRRAMNAQNPIQAVNSQGVYSHE
jgi:hypothetical protein